MKNSDRMSRILTLLEASGTILIQELVTTFAVSEMTIRRDLDQLEKLGSLRRIHGGAIKILSGSYEPPFAVRVERQATEKARIAVAVSELIQDRDTLVLDGGSTGLAIAKVLSSRELTICTPSFRVAEVLRESQGITLLLTGGKFRHGEESLSGAAAIATFALHRFDKYVMTVSGLDARSGCTEWNVEDAEIKRAALRVSQTTIVAADSTKVGKTAFAHICEMKDISVLVSDSNLKKESKSQLSACGIEILAA